MTQVWEKLLFAHWPIPPHLIQQFIPPDLTLDLFEGQAWISVVPFQMRLMLRGIPGQIRFNELNVRTYVVFKGKPGVFFLSLDADHPWMVWGARLSFSLPYFHAAITVVQNTSPDHFIYHCQRTEQGSPSGLFKGEYQSTSPIFSAIPGTLDYWLTERYCLYSINGKKQLFCGHVHHLPWSLQTASVEITENTIVAADGLLLPQIAPILHYSDWLDVILWFPEKCSN